MLRPRVTLIRRKDDDGDFQLPRLLEGRNNSAHLLVDSPNISVVLPDRLGQSPAEVGGRAPDSHRLPVLGLSPDPIVVHVTRWDERSFLYTVTVGGMMTSS